MPLIPKPNYNQIFASQAPEQDKPAVFNNYPLGWGPESRPNNGKPTIKGFNYLQQTSDLKDLWILQNGACLPYDESIEYAEGAPVLKDGVIQYKTAGGFKSRDSVTIPTYSSAADGVDPVTGVADGEYFNVRSSSDESYIDEYQNVGGSAVSTGKSYPSILAVQAVDHKLTNRIYSLTDAGGVGGGADDTETLLSAVNNSDDVLLDTDASAINGLRIYKPATLHGNTALSSTTPARHLIFTGYPVGTPENLNGDLVKGLRFTGMRFVSMPDQTSDDFVALLMRGADAPISAFNSFGSVENALGTSSPEGKSGVKGFGTRDALSLGDNIVGAKRFSFQNYQANYTKIIGLSSHSNGNNDAESFGGVNNGGFNSGVRLTGHSTGLILANSSIRDKSSSVSIQTGATNAIITGNYFENSRDNTINTSTTNLPYGGRHIMSGIQVKNAGGSSVRLRYLGNSYLSGIMDTSESLAIDAAAATSGINHHRLEFIAGAGLVPAEGAVITQGAKTAEVVAVYLPNTYIATVGTEMPSSGEILVRNVSGGFFAEGVLSSGSTTLTATKVYAAEGRNRIDAIVTNASLTSLRLGTDSNIVDLISSACKTVDAQLSGNFNIARLTFSDNPTTSTNDITGSNNIIFVTDNRTTTGTTVLRVSGSNNIIIGNFLSRVEITGSNNYVTLDCNSISVPGSGNDVGGRSNLLGNSGLNNKFNRHSRGTAQGVVTLTTNASGEIVVPHGLASTAKTFIANIVGSSELLHLTVSNVANNATTSLVKVWKADGTPAVSKTLTISFSAKM